MFTLVCVCVCKCKSMSLQYLPDYNLEKKVSTVISGFTILHGDRRHLYPLGHNNQTGFCAGIAGGNLRHSKTVLLVVFQWLSLGNLCFSELPRIFL